MAFRFISGIKGVVAATARSYSAAAAPLTEKTLGYVLSKKAIDVPHMNALRVPSQKYTWSFEALKKFTEAAATGLFDIGVTRGAKVGILAPNNAENLVVQLAAAKIGATAVNLTNINSAADLKDALSKHQFSVLLLSSKHQDKDMHKLVLELFPEMEECAAESTFVPRAFPSLRTILFTDRRLNGTHLLKDVLVHGPFNFYETPLRINSRRVTNTDTALASSSSSLSHKQLLTQASALATQAGISSGDRVLVAVPLSNPVAAVANVACIVSESTIVYAGDMSATELAKLIAAEHINVVVASEALLSALPQTALKSVVVESVVSADAMSGLEKKFGAKVSSARV